MKSIVVFIVAIILTVIFVPLGFLYAFPRLLTKVRVSRAWETIQSYFWVMAVSIDQFVNVTNQELFNDTLVKEKETITKKYTLGGSVRANTTKVLPYRFGNEDETISSVLGKNQRQDTLTTTGKIINYILHLLEKDHSIKSIEEDEINKEK